MNNHNIESRLSDFQPANALVEHADDPSIYIASDWIAAPVHSANPLSVLAQVDMSQEPHTQDSTFAKASFEQLVKEEIAIQTTNLPINGGLPSCVTLFDNMMLCFAIPQQVKSLYRYGTAKDCSAKWDDFKFCMSNRNLSEEEKTAEWIRRRAEHWAERRSGPSSEDLWTAKKLY